MDPVLLTFHAPIHDLDLVARHVVRDHLPEHLVRWKRITNAFEMVYLTTCQRAMWMFWGGTPEHLRLPSEVARYEGEAAWRHLLEVGTGLMSANLGDREVVDQLRTALDQARDCGTASTEATAVIEDVLREALRLRVKAGLADGSASVASVALHHLEEAMPQGGRAVLVGVGPMTTYLAERLPERGFQVTISNRTQSKAEKLGFPTVPLGQLMANPEGFDVLVTATSSPRPLFTLAAWESLKLSHLRILDLGLPPDTEAALGQLPWIHRVDLTAFMAETEQARQRRRHAAEEAEPMLIGAVHRLRRRAEERAQKSHLRTAQDRLKEAWDQLEEEALGAGSVLGHMDEGQKEALKAVLKRGRTLAFRAMNQGNQELDSL